MVRAHFYFSIACLLMATGSHEALASEKPQTSHACAAVADSAKRLACYDKSFPPGPLAAAALMESSRQNFGLTEKKQDANVAQQIDATLVTTSYANGGQRIFELDNGQIWRETESSRMGTLKKGDKIIIRKGALSSFLLITPSDVSLRVKRVK
jgi:hypothetical protein